MLEVDHTLLELEEDPDVVGINVVAGRDVKDVDLKGWCCCCC